jgi:pimeloyl-ACP methyl ester carboxylesterase
MADSGDHRSVVLFGERIAHRQIGDRWPVVVLLHGLADIGHSGQPATHLPTDGRGGAMTVIVADLRGHGLSAAERVPDQGDLVVTQPVEQVAQQVGARTEGVIGARPGGLRCSSPTTTGGGARR